MAYPSLTQLFGLCLLVIIDLFVNIATVDITPYPREIRPCVLLQRYRADIQVQIVHLYLKYLSFGLCNETCLHRAGEERRKILLNECSSLGIKPHNNSVK